MDPVIDGDLNAEGMRFGIVVAKFNDFVTLKLLEGAKSALLENCLWQQRGKTELFLS